MRRLAAATALLLLTGCGLSVESGVQRPGPVSADDGEVGTVEFRPPGPADDAGPRDLVQGFLDAQASPADDHGVARQYLMEPLRSTWVDDGVVEIFDPQSVEVEVPDESRVLVRARVVGEVLADGDFVLRPGALEDVYRLGRDEQGRLRLTDVPSGLRLPPQALVSSFEPYDVYFLRPSESPRPAGQLVPDRAFLPVAPTPEDLARALVVRLLAGPSEALETAVTTAVPPGSGVRSVELDGGVVTVDLSGTPPDDVAVRRQLSAQLVWTLQEALPAAPAVRVLVEGRPLEVPDVGQEQDRADWLAFDPAGSAGRAAALYVDGARLQRTDGTPARSAVTDGSLPVDAVAVSPSTGQLALLRRGADPAGDVVLVGPPPGPFMPVLVAPAVRSLSWGSGERGLYVVAGAGPRLLRVPLGGGEAVEVPITAPAGAGPLASVRVSRDDARVAAVFGRGEERRLHVGKMAVAPLRVSGLRAIGPALVDVADVAWESGTSLVALARLDTPERLPVRIAVDGSEVEPIRTIGLVGDPQTVAAAPGRPLVVGSVLPGEQRVLLVDVGGRYDDRPGGEPAYPG